jgi:hypothetical protein
MDSCWSYSAARLAEQQILHPAYPTNDWRRLRGPRRAGSQDDNSSIWGRKWTTRDVL